MKHFCCRAALSRLWFLVSLSRSRAGVACLAARFVFAFSGPFLASEIKGDVKVREERGRRVQVRNVVGRSEKKRFLSPFFMFAGFCVTGDFTLREERARISQIGIDIASCLRLGLGALLRLLSAGQDETSSDSLSSRLAAKSANIRRILRATVAIPIVTLKRKLFRPFHAFISSPESLILGFLSCNPTLALQRGVQKKMSLFPSADLIPPWS